MTTVLARVAVKVKDNGYSLLCLVSMHTHEVYCRYYCTSLKIRWFLVGEKNVVGHRKILISPFIFIEVVLDWDSRFIW